MGEEPADDTAPMARTRTWALLLAAALAPALVACRGPSPEPTGGPAEQPRPPGPTVSVTEHGADGGDDTDDTAAFRAAIDLARDRREGLEVPPGTYVVSAELELPAAVPGVWLADGAVVRQTVDAPVFARRGEVAAGPVELTHADEGSSSVTVAAGAVPLEPGDWLLVASEREVHRGKGFRLGSLRQVVEVDGPRLTLDRPLRRDLTDGTTGWVIDLAPPVAIVGGTIEHAAPLTAREPLLLLQWVDRPDVQRVELRGCGGSAVKTAGTVGGRVAGVRVHDCVDDHDGERFGSGPHYGYGVEVTGPTRDLVVTGSARAVRHAFTTNGSFDVGVDALRNVGEPEGVDVSMRVEDTTSSGLDTHELGIDIRFHDCLVRGAGRYVREGSADGKEGGAGIFIRSPRTVVEDCVVEGAATSGVVVAAPTVEGWDPADAPRIVDTVVEGSGGRAGVELKQPTVVDGVVIEGRHEFGIQFHATAAGSEVVDTTIDLEGPEKTFGFVNAHHVRLQGNAVHADQERMG